jgi:N-acetylneuraminate synthase
MYGSDQAASIEAHSLKNFVESVRAIPSVLGSGEKILSESEKAARGKLRISIEE